jgi:3-hydroxyisobutyrate dehydrogenase-like beta-hydroxyacid dehydrogenase
MQIGLVGLGRMGAAMAERLCSRGLEVIAWDIDPRAIARQKQHGMRIADGAAAVATAADLIISSITEDSGARRLFCGPGGFLEAPVAGKLFVEMSTLQPATVRKLAAEAKARGARLIDSPVMGSIPMVREGRLVALVGGQAEDVGRGRAVLDHLTRRIIHLGGSGCGSAMKLAVNLGMAAYLQALSESLALGAGYGLSLEQMLDVLAEAPTANPWLRLKLDILKGGHGDVTIDIRTMRKDVMSAVATGASEGIGMPVAAGALTALAAAVAAGNGEEDIAEMPRIFREHLVQRYE